MRWVLIMVLPFLPGCAGLLEWMERNEGTLQTVGQYGMGSGSTIGMVGGGLILSTLAIFGIVKKFRGGK